MKTHAYKRFTFISLSLLIGLTLSLCLWVWNEQRQYALNRDLIASLEYNDPKRAIRLVKAGADPNTHYKPSPKPSFHNLWNHWIHSTPPTVDPYDLTAIQMACGEVWLIRSAGLIGPGQFKPDSPELVETMLRHGANASVLDNDWKRSLLMCAAASRRPATVELLLKYGANINARDKDGKTPLMWAYTSPETIRLLVKHGANVEDRDEKGDTALIVACSYGASCDDATVSMLITEGARVNDQNRNGDTALWWAVFYWHSHKNIAQELLRYGADPYLLDKRNDTPFKVAEAFHHSGLVALFRKYRKHP